MNNTEYIEFLNTREYRHISDLKMKELINLDNKFKNDKEFRKEILEEIEEMEYKKYRKKQTYFR